MYWQEEEIEQSITITDEVVDVAFSIECKCLPVDHAYELSQAVQAALPWFAEEEDAALHTIHVAESANGWMRPHGENAVLHPSRRTKFKLRVPKHRIEDAKRLVGQTFTIEGFTIAIKKADVRKLSDHTTVFSRYIVTDGFETENDVLDNAARQLQAIGIKPKKMMCGTETVIKVKGKQMQTRSLMLADLSVEESIRLQMKGLGEHQWLGCGVFIPHKGIKEVKD
jgi:CRISPR-associated protein Cas6